MQFVVLLIGKAGRSLKPVHVLLVGTHADCICAGDSSVESTAAILLQTVSQKFNDLVFGTKMFSLNALEAMSSEMKALRSAIADLKTNICQVLAIIPRHYSVELSPYWTLKFLT